jgi:ATP/maltotriose-dependent transcriptional regulator MalT/DNA-binding SARP family transcriptional activator
LILLLGQAAQGKTTLAAAYLESVDRPVAWIDLDGAAADPANLYYLLGRSLDQAGFLADSSPFLDKPALALGPEPGGARWQARLRELFGQLNARGVLVIDGLDHIPDASASHAMLQILVDLLPPKLQLVMVSRREPHLRFQYLALRRQALVINNRELAFNLNETAAFFKQALALDLTTSQARRICAMTGGWAGGLVLLSAALERRPPEARLGYLDQAAPRRLSGDALRYFSEDVFAAQPQAIQAFLLRSAVLDEMTADMAARFCGVAEARPQLDDLLRRNLFIQAFDTDGGQPVYRYNHLFHGFLRARLTTENPPDEIHTMEDNAGDLYWECGQIEAAITHYLRGAKARKAAAGVRKIGVDLFIRGRQADLGRWLGKLPPQMVDRDPWLRLLRVLSRRISGGHHNQEDLEFALHHFRKEEDRRGELMALAFLIESGVFLGIEIDVQRSRLDTAEALLTEMTGDHHYLFARTLLWFQVGLGRIVSGLDVARGCAACRRAVLLAEQMEDPVLRLNAAVGLALGQLYRGAFDHAKKTLVMAAASEHSDAYPEYGILDRLVRVELAIHRGDHGGAARDLERIQGEIESFALLFLYPLYLDLCGWLALSRVDPLQALQYGHQLADVAALAASPIYQGLAMRMTALANYHLGKTRLAHRQAQAALACFGQSTALELHTAHIDLLLGLTTWRRGHPEQAQKRLTHLLEQPWLEQGQPQLLTETHLALALVHHDLGQAEAALTHRRASETLIEGRGESAFLFLTTSDLGEVERLWAAMDAGGEGLCPAAEAARHLQGGPPPAPVGPVGLLSTEPPGQVPILEIRTFGGLAVMMGAERPIADRQWGGRLPKLLLKAIIVHGLCDIPKEVLSEDLWPEADPTAAARNFKVTLHRLRKVLQPDLGGGVRSAYVHLFDGRVSLDKTHCRVDVPHFLAAAKKIRNGGASLGDTDILTLCEQARDLYAGDFLPEELYAPWAEMKRLALRDTFQQVLETEARILARAGHTEAATERYADLLRLDPCLEIAAQALMEIYALLGRRGDALRVYADFAAALDRQLGAPPDTVTQALFEQIRAGGPH